MTYRGILHITNEYQEVTGIRDFCRTQCQGQCCSDLTCLFQPLKCESRLPCSLYLCDYVEAHVINYMENGEQIVDLLREIDLIICGKLREMEQTTFVYKLDSGNHMNLIFEIPDITLLLNPQPQEVFIHA